MSAHDVAGEPVSEPEAKPVEDRPETRDGASGGAAVATRQPGPALRRIELIDALRGLALLGVLLSNMLLFSGRETIGQYDSFSEIDLFARGVLKFLVEGKAITTFSLLFGLGFALQLRRAGDDPEFPQRYMKGRLLWLAIFGVVHGSLIWMGDILLAYAVTGFVMVLLFRDVTQRVLTRWVVGLAIVYPVTAIPIILSMMAQGGYFEEPEPYAYSPAASVQVVGEVEDGVTSHTLEIDKTEVDPIEGVPAIDDPADSVASDLVDSDNDQASAQRAVRTPSADVEVRPDPDRELEGVPLLVVLDDEERLDRWFADSYRYGEWHDVAQVRLIEWLSSYIVVMPFIAPLLLGIFLVGLKVGRAGVHERPGDYLPQFRRAAWIGWALGLPMAAFYAFYAVTIFASAGSLPAPEIIAVWILCGLMGALTLAMGYISTFVLLWERGGIARRVQSIFSPVGRMALTNYLSQSIICTTLFYGFGFGFFHHWGTATTTAIALAIFAVQIVLSHVWLRFFRFGPMEWLWRRLAYHTAPPMLGHAETR